MRRTVGVLGELLELFGGQFTLFVTHVELVVAGEVVD